MSYDTREERDAELKHLRGKTTCGHLRPAYEPLRGRMRVEDEEADRLRPFADVR